MIEKRVIRRIVQDEGFSSISLRPRGIKRVPLTPDCPDLAQERRLVMVCHEEERALLYTGSEAGVQGDESRRGAAEGRYSRVTGRRREDLRPASRILLVCGHRR